jgi:hypothetical protein
MAFRAIAERDPAAGPVGVYKNLKVFDLRTGACRDTKRQWSGRAIAGAHKDLKVAEGESFVITDARPFVRESTRQRMLAGDRANSEKGARGFREVHAWVFGTLSDDDTDPGASARRITYHPFERGVFFYADTGEEFTGAARVTFASDGNVYAE